MDSKYKEGMKIRELKYMSDEYIDILKQKPKLGKYFAVAKNIIVLFEKECYRVSE